MNMTELNMTEALNRNPKKKQQLAFRD